MEKNILKIDIGDLLDKYAGRKCSFVLTCATAVIESSSDLYEVDLGYTKNSSRHADNDVQEEGKFPTLKSALCELRTKSNDYYYNVCGCGDTSEWEVEVWDVDEDGEETVCLESIPCPDSNLEDFAKAWEKQIDDEFHEITLVEWVNCAVLDED